jgi:peptidyl-prolyl cis-trans isomerase SurA
MMKTKRMKKFCMLCAMALCTGSAFSQTLIYYGNSEVGKDEFLRAYNKNKPAVTDKEKALRDYLDLYTNFKLKVKAAQELHLDTVAQIRYDVQNFRDQVTENYMGDDKGIQALVDEGAARAVKDVHVLVFSVPVAANAKPEDTTKAYNAVKEAYSILQKGSDYEDAVTALSEKYVPVRYSDAGFVTAFSLPYEFENIVYNTKPGNVSAPYRNAKGWYVLKVTEERPDAGKWRVAQVLLAFPPNADNITKLAVKQKADSVYGLLQKGLAFGDAAKLYSDDRMTYMAQGELPEFSTGRYDPAFEAQVFKLAANNDITTPFETPYGYHIVKRISRTPVPADKNDPSYQFDIKQKVIADSRMNSVREKFAKDVMVKTGYKRPAGVSEAELYRYADTLMKNPTIENTNDQPISKKNIIIFKDGSPIKGDEWLKYVREVKSTPDQSKVESNKVLWDKFATQSALNYYKKNLESYNSDFKYQMQEFREGNMLFEIMERNVWGKAGADNAALKSYYEAHKTNYKWAQALM